MYQNLPLSSTDIVALRAALSTQQFSALTALVPGLKLALDNPIPWVSPYGAYDAVCEARNNTNYPEDWDDFYERTSAAIRAANAFFAAVKDEKPMKPVSPLVLYGLVMVEVGSGDDPTYGEHVYADFEAACGALLKWAREEHESMDCDYAFSEYSNPDKQAYGVNLLSGCSVARAFYLQPFTLPNAERADEGTTEEDL